MSSDVPPLARMPEEWKTALEPLGGRAFHARCRTVLAEVEAAEAVVRELSVTPRGRLRVNAPVTFGSVALAPLITRYLRDYPGVDVELTLTDRYVDIVDEGYDAVIRLGALKDSTLTARVRTSMPSSSSPAR